ncbi:MAG TPA: hypothetical protein VIF62_05040 [Labilithrix sp.]
MRRWIVVLLGVAIACGSEAASTTSAPPAPSVDAGFDAPPGDDGAPDAAEDAGADADAASPCPAGATLVADDTACAGAPPSVPAALASDLAGASAGDVVSMHGLDEGAAPCLPAYACTPEDAPSMMFSDSPESPSSDGVLYADTPPAGRHRIYVYHANGGAALRKFPVVVLNANATDATVTIVRRGVGTPSQSYVAIGKDVLAQWLAPMAPIAVTVPAGQRVLLDATLDAKHAAQDELVHAIFDVETSAPVKISIVSVLAGADAAATTAGLSLLPADGLHVRGTFGGADRLFVAAGAATSGVQHVRLGDGVLDPDLAGIDATTSTPVKLGGNYGVLYRFSGMPSSRAALSERGGSWGGVLGSVELPSASESLGTTTDAVVLGDLSGGGSLVSGGGSNLPVDVFFATP